MRVLLKRDDLIHPDFPGNKWRKLKYNLEAAAGHETLLTFGGAYSNHILATAAAGHYFGFRTIGIIRGEEHLPLNPVLRRAAGFGMTLSYVDRTTYREKSGKGGRGAGGCGAGGCGAGGADGDGDCFVIPEGGANGFALRGCAELVGEIDVPFDVLCCSAGTGATLAGAATALAAGQRAIGFAALKGGFLAGDVRRLQEEFGRPTTNWHVEKDFHFGGFAKTTVTLDAFIAKFRGRYGVLLDRVYEAKMMYGLLALIDEGRFRPGTTIVAVIA
ncbi:1-aminocyclopropane-1-carboxylate deaminase/D-cysteine desulfhydrase [Actinoplanes sp. CA-030573]|uniref:1-aminocyclopropane-1-carboxylate deaminase/D-cysteine desulfhydrase n=1 Tax=Actinoplanes sp. CA-030573 TaxID=3239898 RepID=UPI003D91E934